MVLIKNNNVLIQIELSDIDENGYCRIPDEVTTIGVSGSGMSVAGKTQSKLKAIDINNVKTIKENAFKHCTHLNKVIGSPTFVNKCAFSECASLLSFDFSNTLKVGDHSFAYSGIKEVNLHHVSDVEAAAFLGCQSLTSVKGAPMHIGHNAFAGCSILKSFDFSKVKTIGDGAFADSALIEIDISNLKTVSPSAFSGCYCLEKVTGAPECISSYAFARCGKLKELDFSKITILGHDAFNGSGLEHCVHTSEKLRRIEWNGSSILFVSLGIHNLAFRISAIIDATKNAFVNKDGIPFILDPQYNQVVTLNEDKEHFLQLWNAS